MSGSGRECGLRIQPGSNPGSALGRLAVCVQGKALPLCASVFHVSDGDPGAPCSARSEGHMLLNYPAAYTRHSAGCQHRTSRETGSAFLRSCLQRWPLASGCLPWIQTLEPWVQMWAGTSDPLVTPCLPVRCLSFPMCPTRGLSLCKPFPGQGPSRVWLGTPWGASRC